MNTDNINHPQHYQHPSGIECIDITEHMNFCLGNAIKYIWRCETERINTTKSASSTSPVPQTNPALFSSKAEARVADFREQMIALAQVHEVIKAEERAMELREQMSALAQAHEIWLRDPAMKEERR